MGKEQDEEEHIGIINDDTNAVGNFNNNLYEYTIKEQTSRWKFYIISLISFGLLVLNEYQYYYNNLSFRISSNDPNFKNLSGSIQKEYNNIFNLSYKMVPLLVFYFVVSRIQYVYRCRAHLLLSLNVILVKDFLILSIESTFIGLCALLPVFYEFSKYSIINHLNVWTSLITCNSNEISLFFQDKSSHSMVLTLLLPFFHLFSKIY